MRLKLVSPKDTLLGHIDVPDQWNEWLERAGAALTLILPKFRWPVAEELATPVALNVQEVMVVRAGWSEYRDAVWLAKGTIEQLEALPGCSFTPSMTYLRSQSP